MPTLLVRRSAATGPTRALRLTDKTVLIGRSPNCTICLKDPAVSRLHCVITRGKGSAWHLIRHKSASSLRVDGAEVDWLRLRGGESIALGEFTIVFDATDAAASHDEPVRFCAAAGARHDRPPASLRMQTGMLAGLITQLTKDVTVIGRGEMADVVLTDRHCSRSHAEIHRVDGDYVLHDLGSMNGAFVNDVRVVGDLKLRTADVITIGESRLTFVMEGTAGVRLTPPENREPLAHFKRFPTPRPRVSRGQPIAKVTPGHAAGFVAFSAAAVLLTASLFVPRRPNIESSTGRRRPVDATRVPASADREPRLERPQPAGNGESRPAFTGRGPAGARHAASVQTTTNEPPTPAADRRLAAADRPPRSAVARRPVEPATRPADDEHRDGQVAPTPGDETARPAVEPARPAQAGAGERAAFAAVGHDGTAGAREPQTPRAAPGEPDPVETAHRPASKPHDAHGPGSARLAAPDQQDVETARKTVQAAYADELAATPTSRRLIASLVDAAEQSSRPASKYALLLVAEQVARRDRGFRQLAAVIDVRGRIFDIDTLETRLAALRAAASTAADKAPDLFDVVVTTAHEAMRAERFDVATRAVTLAAQLASFLDQESQRRGAIQQPPAGSTTAGGNPVPYDTVGEAAASEATFSGIVLRLRHAVSECRSLQRKHATALEALEENPNDARSREIVGKYLCFVRDDWRAGLASLAAGRDPELTALAAREIALFPSDANWSSLADEAFVAEVFAVADAWWTFADWHRRSVDLPSWAGKATQSHAAQLYRTIVGLLDDPVETRLARQRIAAAESEPGTLRRTADSRP